jgi:predicted HAD superfamily Cof-like phosphohydrolase
MISGDDLEAFGYWDMVDAYPPKEKTVLQMVEEYRVTAGQEKDPDMNLKLVLEEYCEFWDLAEKEHRNYKPIDEVATLKELADLVYVIYGYANSMGWNLDEAVRRVHEDNMGRMYQPDGTIKRREDGKILRNKDYPSVDLSDLV